jgi:hypothetical protein
MEMAYNFSINERFSVKVEHAGRERQPVLIVDDVLRDPAEMIRYAANESQFKPPPTLYPGITAKLPDAYVDGLAGVLVPLMGETFGVRVDTAFLVDSFFALATYPAEQLHFRQRLPHVDCFEACQVAALHYLCDGSQGGTALYRHRATGYESLNEEKSQQMQCLISQVVASNPVSAEYPNANNRLFEQTANFEAKFNRLIAYRANVLHSMAVTFNTKLSSDPRIGRLTANTNFRFDVA